ncbi:MAG TPA: hypothetical protein VLB46_17235 [Pyrinomonadaceae bacterium]|nr:hypothetical protein [Pyrinomonadaceae bacterium]
MLNKRTDLGVPLAVIELLARVGSVASITFLVLLFQAEAFHPSEIAPREWIGLLFFPIGVIAGMIIAWWKEGVGAIVTLGSLLGFYLVYGYLFRYHISGPWFLVFASPGFLFMLHWFFYRTEDRSALSWKT